MWSFGWHCQFAQRLWQLWCNDDVGLFALGTAGFEPQHLQPMTLITQHKPLERSTDIVFMITTPQIQVWLNGLYTEHRVSKHVHAGQRPGAPAPMMIQRFGFLQVLLLYHVPAAVFRVRIQDLWMGRFSAMQIAVISWTNLKKCAPPFSFSKSKCVSQDTILPQYLFAKVLLCQNIILPKYNFAKISCFIMFPKFCFAKISFCQI